MESHSERVATSPTYYLFSVCAVLIECLLLSVLMRLISVLFFVTYFDRMDLAYSLPLIGYLSHFFQLILTYPRFFRSNK